MENVVFGEIGSVGETGSGATVKVAPLSIIEIFAVVVPSLLLLVHFLAHCNRGFDFTDEGYYLNFISNPWLYDGSVTQFGYIYYGIYWLINGDISFLRQVNIGITLALAWLLSYIVLRRSLLAELTSSILCAILSFSLATVILGGLEIATPSYNSLNLQGLLITMIGITLVGSANPLRASLAAVMIGLGGWLVAMARPTTAFVLGILILIYFIAAQPRAWNLLIIAATTAIALMLATAFWIDGSPTVFVANVFRAYDEFVQLTKIYSVQGVLSWDPLLISGGEVLIFYAIIIIATLLSVIALSASPVCIVSRITITSMLALASVFIVLGFFPPTFPHHIFWIAAIPLGVAFVAILFGWRRLLLFIGSRNSLFVGLLILIPFAYAFGTGTNILLLTANASIFWCLAVIILCATLIPSRLLITTVTLVMGVTAVNTVNVLTRMENPYRQTMPLRLQTHMVTIGASKTSLLVGRRTARYLTKLLAIARENGMAVAAPLVDLTGANPGTVFALGAEAIGSPWLIGGYPGSTEYAIHKLDRVSCQKLASSWLLINRKSKRKLPDDLMSRYGYSLDKDYNVVARVRGPYSSGSASKSEHTLLKPNSGGRAVATCNRTKAAR